MTSSRKSCLLVLAVCGLSIQSAADVYYVAQDGLDANSGTETSPFATIQKAVDEASGGDTIMVGDGVYTSSAPATVFADFGGKSLRILGNMENPACVSLDGEGAATGFTGVYSSAQQFIEIAGFSFTNCFRSSSGGAIDLNFANGNIEYSKVEIHDCCFMDNYAEVAGGAIQITGRSGFKELLDIEVWSCDFYRNSGTGGGAIRFTYGSMDVRDCDFVENVTRSSTGGGAFYTTECSVDFSNSRFVSNSCVTASSGGGALMLYRGFTVIKNCVFEFNSGYSDNSEILGGAIYTRSGLEVHNSVFRGNKANKYSAIYGMSEAPWVRLYNSLLYGNECSDYAIRRANGGTGEYHVVNCTLVGNTGGGIAISGTANAVGQIRNSIVLGNSLDDKVRNYNFPSDDVRIIKNSCTSPLPSGKTNGGGNINADPLFANVEEGDFGLLPGSPCIDAGENEDWMTGAIDLAGRARLDRGSARVDLGCYEYVPVGSFLIVR